MSSTAFAVPSPLTVATWITKNHQMELAWQLRHQQENPGIDDLEEATQEGIIASWRYLASQQPIEESDTTRRQRRRSFLRETRKFPVAPIEPNKPAAPKRSWLTGSSRMLSLSTR